MSQSLLKKVLYLDAAASGATGLMLAVGAAPLEGLLGLPEALMRPTGLFLVGYAAAVALVGRQAAPNRRAVMTIIVLNILWTVESGLFLSTGQAQPTPLGTAFVIFQAAVVGALALAQIAALRLAKEVQA